jgi:hypothetical protein
MSHKNHLPDTVSASLEARLAPYPKVSRAVLEDLDVEASLAVAPRTERRLRLSLVNDLKLLFAALGAGNGAVPMGDNGRTTRLLSEYAAALRRH